MSKDSSWGGTDIFRPANYLPYWKTEVPDYISGITNPLIAKFLKAAAQSLMIHVRLKYEDIRVVNNGACLNYNLFCICSDPNCSYRRTKANFNVNSINAVKIKLEYAISSYIAEGGVSKKRNRPVKS